MTGHVYVPSALLLSCAVVLVGHRCCNWLLCLVVVVVVVVSVMHHGCSHRRCGLCVLSSWYVLGIVGHSVCVS
jgi:hypothetical protein